MLLSGLGREQVMVRRLCTCRYWVALLREFVCRRLPVPDNRCFLLGQLSPAAGGICNGWDDVP